MAKILVIDDEALLAKSLSIILAKAGHTVVTAENGKLGLEAFAREQPDLVITDIIMPVMEGIEAIQALRSQAPHLPIIAVSGGGRTKNLEFLRIAEKLGANAALPKPFTKEQLLTIVGNCLAGKVGG
ncbi:MAG: response regulator [Rhodospirillaceae bacterium]|nr:MAG: response regulator [Rhodospirillaceae bacterium]